MKYVLLLLVTHASAGMHSPCVFRVLVFMYRMRQETVIDWRCGSTRYLFKPGLRLSSQYPKAYTDPDPLTANGCSKSDPPCVHRRNKKQANETSVRKKMTSKTEKLENRIDKNVCDARGKTESREEQRKTKAEKIGKGRSVGGRVGSPRQR